MILRSVEAIPSGVVGWRGDDGKRSLGDRTLCLNAELVRAWEALVRLISSAPTCALAPIRLVKKLGTLQTVAIGQGTI